MHAAEPVTPSAGLDALIFPSTQYAHADIFHRTPSGFGPTLYIAEEIAPGQRLDLVPLVHGYAVDQERKAHVTYEVTIHGPTGGVQRLPGSILLSDSTQADSRAALFPRNIARFNTNPGDPAGSYRFEIAIRDEIGGKTVTKSATVRVAESDASLPLPAGLDPLRFLTDYYQRPRPRLALPVLTAFSRTSFAARKADGHGTLLGFYDQVLRDNPWLIPQFTQRLAATPDDSERRILALVLAYAKRDEPQFGSDLPRGARAQLAAAKKEAMPFPSREPTTGGQLDLQWGAFLASGRFEPIETLVAVVKNYLPYAGKLEEFKKLPTKPKVLPPEMMKDVLLGSALWSLGSNAHQQKLVRDYLVGIERANETLPEVKAALRGALAWRPKDAPPAATPPAP